MQVKRREWIPVFAAIIVNAIVGGWGIYTMGLNEPRGLDDFCKIIINILTVTHVYTVRTLERVANGFFITR